MEHSEKIAALSARIAEEPKNAELYMERGRLHYGAADFGHALNDFNRILVLQPDNVTAQQYVRMINEILEYRYTDIYNP